MPHEYGEKQNSGEHDSCQDIAKDEAPVFTLALKLGSSDSQRTSPVL
jgi:hypothetical protein